MKSAEVGRNLPKQSSNTAVEIALEVALDGRIINPDAEDYEGSKINKCIEEILRIDEEHPQTAQVVFCDTNTPQGDAFSVYKDIKEKLIATGKYLPEEIAFIHDASNDKQRLEISTEQLAKPFEYTDELNKLLERKAFLDAHLEFGAADEGSVLIDEDNEEGHEIA